MESPFKANYFFKVTIFSVAECGSLEKTFNKSQVKSPHSIDSIGLLLVQN
jgi:hypothetical protein